MKPKQQRAWIVGVLAILVSIVVFLIPFSFVILQAAKSPAEASSLAYSLPSKWQFFENLVMALSANDGFLIRALINSAILTVCSVTLTVIITSMAGYVLARKKSRFRTPGQLLRPRRIDRPTSGRANHLGDAKPAPLCYIARLDPARGNLWTVVQHPALSELCQHCTSRIGRGGSSGWGWSNHTVHPDCASTAATRDCDGHRRSVRLCF